MALGLRARSFRPPKSDLECSIPTGEIRKLGDSFYFQLEAFLDSWRREGIGEDVVRTALKRAEATSLAMEDVGRRLKGQ